MLLFVIGAKANLVLKQKAELSERWKSGQWVADVARALEDRKRCLRSWLSMEELLQRHTGELRRAVLQ